MEEACAGETASRTIKEYLATFEDAAFGAASEVAQSLSRHPIQRRSGPQPCASGFLRCADNYLTDVKFGIIDDVAASRAIRQAEVGAAKTMIERTQQRFNL